MSIFHPFFSASRIANRKEIFLGGMKA